MGLIRKCKICKNIKSSEYFYKTAGYTRHICKKCENRRSTIWKREMGRKLKIEAVKYLGGKCIDCGYNKCIQALEFDHKYDKKFKLSSLLRNSTKFEQILPEIKKYILRCANCHRERHFLGDVAE